VVGELVLALVLLVGAMLLIRTFAGLHQVDRGFDAHHVLTLRVALTDSRLMKTEAVSAARTPPGPHTFAIMTAR